jgi:hypothetical protein
MASEPQFEVLKTAKIVDVQPSYHMKDDTRSSRANLQFLVRWVPAMKPLYCTLAILVTALFAFSQNTALSPSSPQVMQPEQLVKMIQSGGEKPVILYVGPHMFYTQAHIAGAEYIGPAGKPEGMEKLRARAKSLPHDNLIVVYCGCCPWDVCPNIHPAYDELKKMGFTKLRVLYLATSFGSNWADKGYPTAKGE